MEKEIIERFDKVKELFFTIIFLYGNFDLEIMQELNKIFKNVYKQLNSY